MLYAALVIALVALDQLVKYLVLTHIPLGGHMDFLPHVLEPVSYTHLDVYKRQP